MSCVHRCGVGMSYRCGRRAVSVSAAVLVCTGMLLGCTATLSNEGAAPLAGAVTALKAINDNYSTLMKAVTEKITSRKYSLEEIAPDDEFTAKRVRVEFYYHFLRSALGQLLKQGREVLGRDQDALEDMLEDLNKFGYLSANFPEKFPDSEKVQLWQDLSTDKGWYEFWKHGVNDVRDLDHHLMQLKQDQQLIALIYQNMWQTYLRDMRTQLVQQMDAWVNDNNCNDHSQTVRYFADQILPLSRVALLEMETSSATRDTATAAFTTQNALSSLSSQQHLLGQTTTFIASELTLAVSLLLGVKKLADTLINVSVDNSYSQGTLLELFRRISRVTERVSDVWSDRNTSSDHEERLHTQQHGGGGGERHIRLRNDMQESVTDYTVVTAAVFEELRRPKKWLERTFSVALAARMKRLILLLEDFAPRVTFWMTYDGMETEILSLRKVIESIRQPRTTCSFANSDVLRQFTQVVQETSTQSRLRIAMAKSSEYQEVVRTLREDKRKLVSDLKQMRRDKQKLEQRLHDQSHQRHALEQQVKEDAVIIDNSLARLLELESRLDVSDSFQEHDEQFRRQISQLSGIKDSLEEQLDKQAQQWEKERERFMRQISGLQKELLRTDSSPPDATATHGNVKDPSLLPGDASGDAVVAVRKIEENLSSIRDAERQLKEVRLTGGEDSFAPSSSSYYSPSSSSPSSSNYDSTQAHIDKLEKSRRWSRALVPVMQQVVNSKIKSMAYKQWCGKQWFPRGVTSSKTVRKLLYELGSLLYPDCDSHNDVPTMVQKRSTHKWIKEWERTTDLDTDKHFDMFQRLVNRNRLHVTQSMKRQLAIYGLEWKDE